MTEIPDTEIAIAVEMRAQTRLPWDVIADRMGYCQEVLRREVQRAGHSTDRLRGARRLRDLDRTVLALVKFHADRGRRPPTRPALAAQLGCTLGEAEYAVRKMVRLGVLTRTCGRLDINPDAIEVWK